MQTSYKMTEIQNGRRFTIKLSINDVYLTYETVMYFKTMGLKAVSRQATNTFQSNCFEHI